MKRLGTEGMEGQMPCPVGRQWLLGEDEDMTECSEMASEDVMTQGQQGTHRLL